MNNQINKFLLWWFLLPGGLYRKLGADLPQLRAILVTKLTIDDRTATGLSKARNRNTGGETNMATAITMVISLVFGIMYLFVFVMDDDLNRLTLYFGILSFMLAMFLITDFSHILIDVKDNYIILPKPVSSQTFLIGRLLHIIIHVSKIIVPMALPGWIAIWISRGLWGAVIFIPMMILLTILTFAVVNALYLLIMQVFSPARINSIITTMQIVFSIVLYGSFQLLSRVMGDSFLQAIDLTQYAWIWLFPSFWLAAGWTFLYSFASEPMYIVGAILSVVMPLLSLWLMIRYLAPAFFRKLSMISAGTSGEEKKSDSKVVHHKDSGMSMRLAGLFTAGGIERESFRFVWRMTGRSRDFKLKVYPQIGYLVVIMVMMFVRSHSDIESDLLLMDNTRARLMILTVIYLSSILFMGAIYQLPFYEQFKAAWLYYSPPLIGPGQVISGSIKAMVVKFYLPVVIILTIAGIALFGVRILPNLVCGLGNVFLLCMMYSWLLMDRLPFSVSPKRAGEGQTTFRNMFMLIGLPLFGLPHYFLFDFPIVLCVVGVVTITIGYIVLRYTKGIGWEYMKEG